MKKLTYFLAAILSFVICLGAVNPALAQSAPTLDVKPELVKPPIGKPLPKPPVNPALSVYTGVTSIYNTQPQQQEKAKVYQLLGYNIAIPFIPPIPPNITEAEFYKFLPQLVKSLGDGSITEGVFDFQGIETLTPGANQYFNAKVLNGEKIYGVVAGKPIPACPLQIEDTQIAFFTTSEKAVTKAEKLAKKGYLVYVSPSAKLRSKALTTLFKQYSKNGQDSNCFFVTGATKKITVNLQDIFSVLPPSVQQPAKDGPFNFIPKNSQDFLYVANARKQY